MQKKFGKHWITHYHCGSVYRSRAVTIANPFVVLAHFEYENKIGTKTWLRSSCEVLKTELFENHLKIIVGRRLLKQAASKNKSETFCKEKKLSSAGLSDEFLKRVFIHSIENN